jgi:hypothetical protein
METLVFSVIGVLLFGTFLALFSLLFAVGAALFQTVKMAIRPDFVMPSPDLPGVRK